MISPTDQSERRSPYALFLEATDRQTARTIAAARMINDAIGGEDEAIRFYTIRSHRPREATATDIVQGPGIVVLTTRSGIPGGRRTDARTEEHAFIRGIIRVNVFAIREAGLVPDTIAAAIWHAPTGRAWVVDCLS